MAGRELNVHDAEKNRYLLQIGPGSGIVQDYKLVCRCDVINNRLGHGKAGRLVPSHQNLIPNARSFGSDVLPITA